MKNQTRRKRLPVDLQRDLVGLALLHLRLDRSWEGKDLGGETHQLSELARQYVVDLLNQMLAGKRPYLPGPHPKRRVPADERYVSLINRAIGAGASMEDAYRTAAGASRALATGKQDARIREAKRAWQQHWQQRSEALGMGHRLRAVPPREMQQWITQKTALPKKTPRRHK